MSGLIGLNWLFTPDIDRDVYYFDLYVYVKQPACEIYLAFRFLTFLPLSSTGGPFRNHVLLPTQAQVSTESGLTFCNEPGTSQSVANNNEDQQRDNAADVDYDLDLLIAYPGFNVPVPEGVKDECRRFGAWERQVG